MDVYGKKYVDEALIPTRSLRMCEEYDIGFI